MKYILVAVILCLGGCSRGFWANQFSDAPLDSAIRAYQMHDDFERSFTRDRNLGLPRAGIMPAH